MIAIDASAMLEVLLRAPVAEAVERRLFDSRQTMHAPHLIDAEVAQVIRRYAASRELDADRGRAVLADLADFPLRRYPRFAFAARLELQNNLTAYDAVYVALAEALDTPLLTGDKRLATAAGHHARVELV
jgi:predicted nucleic acid-binding protein